MKVTVTEKPFPTSITQIPFGSIFYCYGNNNCTFMKVRPHLSSGHPNDAIYIGLHDGNQYKLDPSSSCYVIRGSVKIETES